MASTETSPEPALERAEPPSNADGTDAIAARGEGDGQAGIVRLLRELAEDTRTLVEQEIELVRLETARSVRRVAVDTGWIWAGAVVVTVGLICLALALALGIGALLDSYWLGALITGALFLVTGAGLAWRGVGDLKAGGLLPTGPLQSLQEDRDWARSELEDLKQGITEDA